MKQPGANRRLWHRGDRARARRPELLDLAEHERLPLRERQAIERRFHAQAELAPINILLGIGSRESILDRQPLERPAAPEGGALVVTRALHSDREDERL